MLSIGNRIFPETPADEVSWIAYHAGEQCYRNHIGPVMLPGGEMVIPEHEWSDDTKFAYLIAEPGIFWHYYLQGYADAYSRDR